MLAQFDNTTGESLNGVNPICAPISVLLMFSAPFAIGLLIVAVIVNAINRLTLGTLSHIFQKVWERIKPAFANRYTASAVVMIGLMVWIGYASLHVLPTAIGARLGSPVGCASYSYGFSAVAPARLHPVSQQACLLNLSLVAALAKASPIPYNRSASELSWCGFGNYFKSCECSSCEGYFLRHDVGAINVVFNGGCSADTDARHVYYANPRYV